MKWVNVIQRQTKLMIITILLLVSLIVGVSYAFYMQTKSNTTNQTVKSGTLSIDYQSNNGYITSGNYNELLPMSDSDGLLQTGYNFTVKNTGSLPVAYKVYIYINYDAYKADKDAGTITGNIYEDLSKLKLNLTTNNVENNTIKVVDNIPDTVTFKMSNNYPSVTKYQIYSGSINSNNATDTHLLKLWLDEESSTDIIGQYVYLKLEVETTVAE